MKWRSLEESAPEIETRTLREVYAERKGLIAKYVSAEIQATHARAIDELKASGIAERALKPGDPAPEFALQNHNGKLVHSTELLQRGPLLICFFRGRWCPFCVGQMETMNAIVPHLQEIGASLVGISPQTVHQSYLMADQHKLRFPLLSDAGNEVATKFGIIYRVPDYQQEVYSRAFVNLPFVNGDSNWELPIPATFVIGTEQNNSNHGEHGITHRNNPQRIIEQDTPTVLYASANPDYTCRPEPGDLLEFLAQLFS